MTTLDSIRDIRIYQSKSGYRFSVDALLLYSFVNIKSVAVIADLGAGSGIVGLLLAGKYPKARVTLIELQEGLHRLAEKNIELNSLTARVRAVQADLRGVNAKDVDAPFGLVVSNPPFRKPRTGLISPDEERAVARHELKLGLTDLCRAAGAMLGNRGRFDLIHHPERLAELFDSLRAGGLQPKRLRFVHSRLDTGAKMVLVEAVKGGRPGLKVERPLFIYNEDGTKYSEEAAEIIGG